MVVILVLLQPTVVVEGVVVVPGVPDEAEPLTPARRDVTSVILVEVLPQVGGEVAAGLEVGGEGPLLMPRLPAGGAAVLVVGEHMVVVYVQTCTQSVSVMSG